MNGAPFQWHQISFRKLPLILATILVTARSASASTFQDYTTGHPHYADAAVAAGLLVFAYSDSRKSAAWNDFKNSSRQNQYVSLLIMNNETTAYGRPSFLSILSLLGSTDDVNLAARNRRITSPETGWIFTILPAAYFSWSAAASGMPQRGAGGFHRWGEADLGAGLSINVLYRLAEAPKLERSAAHARRLSLFSLAGSSVQGLMLRPESLQALAVYWNQRAGREETTALGHRSSVTGDFIVGSAFLGMAIWHFTAPGSSRPWEVTCGGSTSCALTVRF